MSLLPGSPLSLRLSVSLSLSLCADCVMSHPPSSTTRRPPSSTQRRSIAFETPIARSSSSQKLLRSASDHPGAAPTVRPLDEPHRGGSPPSRQWDATSSAFKRNSEADVSPSRPRGGSPQRSGGGDYGEASAQSTKSRSAGATSSRAAVGSSVHMAAPLSSHGALDKQFRVDSDVRCAAVSGAKVWLGHSDGTMSLRKTRDAELESVMPANPARGRVWSLLAVTTATGLSSGPRPKDRAPSGEPDVALRTVWVGYSTGDIEVFDADTLQLERLVCRHTGGVYCLAEFGGYVYSGSNDFEIAQWKASNVQFMRQFTGHSNYVRCLYAEGSLLLSGSDDATIKIWNVINGHLVTTVKHHGNGVSCLTRAGPCIWSGDDSGRIFVWTLQTLESKDVLTEHSGRINALRKVASRVYSGSSDHIIAVWDAVTRQLVTRISEHRSWILSLTTVAQLCRYYVWSTAADSVVRCWHHDEMRHATRDVERFNDVQWFETEHNPYFELNQELQSQIHQHQSQIEYLTQMSVREHGQLEHVNTFVQQAVTEKQAAEATAAGMAQELEELKRRVQQLEAQNAKKESELANLSTRLQNVHSDEVSLRCVNQQYRNDLEEAMRRLDLATQEKNRLDIALRETLALRTVKGDVAPIIVTSSVEAAEAVLQLQQQLRDSLALNNSLREDLAQYQFMASAAGINVKRGGNASPGRAAATSSSSPGRRSASGSGGGAALAAAAAMTTSVTRLSTAGLVSSGLVTMPAPPNSARSATSSTVGGGSYLSGQQRSSGQPYRPTSTGSGAVRRPYVTSATYLADR